MPTAQDKRFLRLSEAEFSDLTSQVRKHRDEALASRADFPLRHSDRYRRYLTDPTLRPPGPWPESARLFLPTTRTVLERLHAEAWQTTMGDPFQIQVTPFGEDDIDKAEIMGRFLRWTLAKTMDWVGLSMDLLFDGLMDSAGVCKITAWEPPWEPPSKGARRFLQRSVRGDALDLGMLLVAPDAEGLQYPEGLYIHQEFFLTSDDLWRMGQRGFDVPSYEALGYSQQMTDRKRAELERGGERVVEFHPESVPFVESYERYRLDDDRGEEDLIISWFPDAMVSGTSSNTTENHGRIAGVRRLTEVYPQDDRPRRPFFPLTFWPQPRQWRGQNIPDRLETLQDLINRLHEQLVNYGEVSMLPYVFANTFMTGELPDLRTVRPGATVAVDDFNGLQFAPTRSLNRHFAEIINIAQTHVERDSNVTDINLGRKGERTASATMALLAESRRSYSMLIRKITSQFESLLTFQCRLWQEILPDKTLVQIFEPQAAGADAGAQAAGADGEAPTNLWDRLFTREALSDRGSPRAEQLVSRPMSRDSISGLFDVSIEVDPEAHFNRQVLSSLFQVTAPLIQDYPLGLRLMLKRLWSSFDQKGFDDVYPEQIALLQTEQRFMAIQVQLAISQQQLDAIAQEEAQQNALPEGGAGDGQGEGGLSATDGAALEDPAVAALLQQLLAGSGNGENPSG